MKIVLQRVKEASVTVGDKVISKIGHGFLILLGIEAEDTQEDINWLSGKTARLRVFSDENGAMNKSIIDVDGEVSKQTHINGTRHSINSDWRDKWRLRRIQISNLRRSQTAGPSMPFGWGCWSPFRACSVTLCTSFNFQHCGMFPF